MKPGFSFGCSIRHAGQQHLSNPLRLAPSVLSELRLGEFLCATPLPPWARHRCLRASSMSIGGERRWSERGQIPCVKTGNDRALTYLHHTKLKMSASRQCQKSDRPGLATLQTLIKTGVQNVHTRSISMTRHLCLVLTWGLVAISPAHAAQNDPVKPDKATT